MRLSADLTDRPARGQVMGRPLPLRSFITSSAKGKLGDWMGRQYSALGRDCRADFSPFGHQPKGHQASPHPKVFEITRDRLAGRRGFYREPLKASTEDNAYWLWGSTDWSRKGLRQGGAGISALRASAKGFLLGSLRPAAFWAGAAAAFSCATAQQEQVSQLAARGPQVSGPSTASLASCAAGHRSSYWTGDVKSSAHEADQAHAGFQGAGKAVQLGLIRSVRSRRRRRKLLARWPTIPSVQWIGGLLAGSFGQVGGF